MQPRRSLLAALLLSAQAGCGGGDGGAADASSGAADAARGDAGEPDGGRTLAPLEPAAGTLFGMTGPITLPWQREEELGGTLRVHHSYWAWEDTSWPGAWAAALQAGGRLVMISWNTPDTPGWIDGLLAGDEDGVIRAKARKVRDAGYPIFLRWGYEMNGNWTGIRGFAGYWNTGVADPTDDDYLAATRKYMSGWRRIVDLFRDEGATNAVWVWCPANNAAGAAAAAAGTPAWKEFRNYYPGDEYVDWVAFDDYNWGTSQDWSSWVEFDSFFAAGSVYDAYAARKPIMIGEFGSVEAGGSKPTWFADAREAGKALPRLKALVYFDKLSGNADWRVDTTDQSLAAFAAWATDPYYAP